MPGGGGSHPADELRDRHRIDPIGLAASQGRVAERLRLQRIEHHNAGDAALRQPGVQREPVHARRLERDGKRADVDARQLLRECVEAGTRPGEPVPPDRCARAVQERRFVPALADVDPRVQHG
ncbi:hypothetical protein tb265_03460 [Gemmatimonadetes bacterium T265]|nr:hypothetical protein tb265_03460 [Gemmatimonadetes bacterium T265]